MAVVQSYSTPRIGSVGVAQPTGSIRATGSSGLPVTQAQPVNVQPTYNPAPTYSPQQAYSVGGQRDLLPSGSSGGVLGYSTSDPVTQPVTQPQFVAPDGRVYASAAAYQADRSGKANALKGGLTGIVNSIKGVYDALYGDVAVAGADKNRQVLDVYNQDVQGLTDQFAGEFPAIGRAFSARNTYDSSYRQDREGAARTGFENTLASRGKQRDTDLSTVGQFIAEKQAGINSQKGLQDQLLGQLMASDNPDEIQQSINQLQAKMAELQSSRAGLGSQASYLNTLNQTVPGGSRLESLRPSLSNVIKSQVPAALKQQIATNLINSAGLSPEQVQAALGEFNVMLSEDENRQIA